MSTECRTFFVETAGPALSAAVSFRIQAESAAPALVGEIRIGRCETQIAEKCKSQILPENSALCHYSTYLAVIIMTWRVHMMIQNNLVIS